MKKFYITTTLPYVNAAPHIGFALELVQADVVARYHKEKKEVVFFNTGTDEHGAKVYQKALEEKKDPQQYVNEGAKNFERLTGALHISTTHFIRTTNEHHKIAAQEFWKRCDAHGDIYKKNYKIKYCIGCELEKTDSELENSKCPIHPNLELEVREEENYFFKFSRYQEPLLGLYKEHSDFVLPDFRLNEIVQFVERGLNDFSISRLREKLPWGVPVPGDDAHVMYVWFDALVNYISTLGWPASAEASASTKVSADKPVGKVSEFETWWGTKEKPNAIQIAGKDNLRQQSAMWQAMLLSAGLPCSRQILIHGFITANGQKISKSLGNVVDPFQVIEKYGVDPVRYYLLREIPSYDDGDFSEEKFVERYNADLADGLGNFAARVLTLASREADLDGGRGLASEVAGKIMETKHAVYKKIDEFRLHEALQHIWELIAFGDGYVSEKKPWEKKDVQVLYELVVILDNVAVLLRPFLPETAERITQCIIWEGDRLRTKKGEILFPKIS